MATGSEFFVVDKKGRRTDAPLLEPILDNPAADVLFAEVAIQQALKMGIDEDVAREALKPE